MKGFLLALAASCVEATQHYRQYYTNYVSPTYTPVHSHGVYEYENIDKSDWYGPYQQYSPVRIPYLPGTATTTQYAICDTGTYGNNFSGKIEFAQRPGKATQTKTNITSGTNGGTFGQAGFVNYGSRTYRMIVTEYGDCTTPLSTFSTTDRSLTNRSSTPPAGDEFNPLAERDRLNRLNPYQDPKRGRISEVTSSAGDNAN